MQRIIFFDGICSLCNRFIDFIYKRDIHKQFKFSSLQSKIASSMLAGKYENFDSIVYLEDQKTYFKSTAVLKIMFHLGGIWTVLSIMLSVFPLFIRDYVYDKVAANRYKIFGKKDTCRIPTPTEKESFLE